MLIVHCFRSFASARITQVIGTKEAIIAKIKPEEIIDDLSLEFRRDLSDAVSELLLSVQFDEYEIFRAFKRATLRKCST